MPTLAEAQIPPNMDKLKPVEAPGGSGNSWVRGNNESPGSNPMSFGPVPGSNGVPDSLRQFYKWQVPQYRAMVPSAVAGGGSSTPANAVGTQAIPAPITPPPPLPASGSRFVSNETPTGTIDGTTGSDGNDTFTLSISPNPAASLILTKNGQQIYEGTAFTLSGKTITYLAPYIPVVGDIHRATLYRY